MSDFAPIGRPDPAGPVSYDAAAKPRRVNDATPAGVTRGADRVDVSAEAREATLTARLKDLPVREDLVAEARRQIAEGTYDSEDRIEQAIDAILGDWA
ncbi:flagellar biosynthesis anti-sigma factor FlgM [Phycisphaera mikurensis]|uniref:Anti-sigma-28 factor FlgM C-terminal domain-containing protein n=1 Tax=Phycisphaera mikurensis (strain NBRC 102666 / KCTC 22515 / FYK2301M01) TaxID=1142394 RepID=I0IB49_PHYMF|nr:flagellar biosynthesis anti-sigma factor FlgM [Phycisphaera mikurensis]MBB6442988.1 anti-sigma28 factor (negative regulator of flagellin synthesis) [Phycisphaera mikurensis]BAM02487.1 hypothetical protein PSMK_03280 [Phycisphaera mikurensis NBRC 102666]